ncbi:MAG TPA: hypothetical protein VGK99_18460 [Acidobacteriota bacterium]|jgi:hypothetical protein
MKKQKLPTMMCLGLAILGVTLSCRQSSQPRMAGTGDTLKSVAEMNRECRKHCQKTSTSVDEMGKMMQQARQSNDAAKMKEALAKMENNLDDMKGHLSGCMAMMEMMSTRVINKAAESSENVK